jgi:hypothetical protein
MREVMEEKIKLLNRLLSIIKLLDPGLSQLSPYAGSLYYEMQAGILALAVGGETDDDFALLRQNTDSVRLAKVYLQKTLDAFQYEFLPTPEARLKVLAGKKMEYLNLVLKNPKK